MAEKLHRHKLEEVKPKTVLLAKYRVEDGGMKYVGTTGKDTLYQRKCSCGLSEVYNLERKLA